jgi:hypothetical protein
MPAGSRLTVLTPGHPEDSLTGSAFRIGPFRAGFGVHAGITREDAMKTIDARTRDDQPAALLTSAPRA